MAVDPKNVVESQADVASIRRQPISGKLRAVLSHAARESGTTVNVTSGGQPGKGTGGPRTGSTRHDHGNAADLTLHDSKTGRMLDFTNKDDLPTFKKFVSSAAAAGATGIGAGTGYMGPNTLHVGFGKEKTWGARGGRPPSWLVAAHKEGRVNKVDVGGGETATGAAADTKSGAPTGKVLDRQIVTNYWPITGGDNKGMEGSELTSKPGPTGKYRVSTMEDFRTGKSDYVTIAADPSHYGTWHTIPSYTYKNAANEQHTLKNVPAYVHDTGSFFKNKPRKFDVAVDYSKSDKHGRQLDAMNAPGGKNLNAGTVFVASDGRPARGGGPKPGSSEYWAQGKAKSEPQVAAPLPEKKPGQQVAAKQEPAPAAKSGPRPGSAEHWASTKAKGAGEAQVAANDKDDDGGKRSGPRREPETDRKGAPVQRGEDTGPSGYGAPPSSRPGPVTTTTPENMQTADAGPRAPPPLPNSVVIHVYARRV